MERDRRHPISQYKRRQKSLPARIVDRGSKSRGQHLAPARRGRCDDSYHVDTKSYCAHSRQSNHSKHNTRRGQQNGDQNARILSNPSLRHKPTEKWSRDDTRGNNAEFYRPSHFKSPAALTTRPYYVIALRSACEPSSNDLPDRSASFPTPPDNAFAAGRGRSILHAEHACRHPLHRNSREWYRDYRNCSCRVPNVRATSTTRLFKC
jgi:hypothetical protein